MAFLVCVTVPFPELLYTFILFNPDLKLGSEYRLAPAYAFIVGAVLSIFTIVTALFATFPALSFIHT